MPKPVKAKPVTEVDVVKDHDITSTEGGLGEPIDPHHQRESMRIITMAVNKGWNIPEQWMEKMPAIAAQIATKSTSDRDRLRALEVLKAMAKDRFDAACELNKIERLDKHQPTEIIFNVTVPGSKDADD